MTDDERKYLQQSLFQSTSAFDQQKDVDKEPIPWIPTPERPPARVSSLSQQLKQIATLIEDAMLSSVDEDILLILEEALHLARSADA